MKIFLKLLFSILLFLLYFKALGYSLYAMNLSSDLFASLGILGGVAANAALIFVMYKLWRKI